MNRIKKHNQGMTAATLISLVSLALAAGCQQVATNTPAPIAGPKQAAVKPQFSDEQIKQDATKALIKSGIKASIQVEVKDRLVALKGEVTSLDDRMRIVEAAKSVPGVKAVVRYIDVKPAERSDTAIEKDIRAALNNNPATRDIQPVVSVDRGVVTFAGTGSDWQIKHLARRLVENVNGVREVLNPLCIPYETIPNEDVKKVISARLALSQPNLDHVSVEVNNGRVVLQGKVRSVQDQLQAISAAYVDPVRSVNCSGLLVEAASSAMKENPAEPGDQDIKKVIEIAFAHDPRVAPSKPELAVANGIVTLAGSTFDLEAAKVAGLLAAQMPGVTEVRNNLSVRPTPQRSDEELTATLRNAFLSDPNVDLYQLQVSVDHGRALLRGASNTTREKWKAGEIAMCTRSIVEIDNQVVVTRTPEPAVISHTFFPSWEFTDLWWVIPVTDAKAAAELKAAVERQLYWSPFTNPRTITVAVDSGVVTLTGMARTILEKKAAEDEAYEAGAARVENQLEVISENTAPPNSPLT